jgi:hypothetical protein
MAATNTTELYLLVRDNDTGLEKWTKVDLSDDLPFTLIYSISDVKDITRRNSSYSKTIVIPGTPTNNKLFSHIFDVSLSAAIPIFNPNKKVKCYVLRDTLQIFEGSFQLRNIMSNDNRHAKYECVIYGENASFSQAIKEKFMSEIRDFIDLDHFYTYQNIVDSWGKDWTHGYYYPLIDYGKLRSRFIMRQPRKGPRVRDFKPGIYVKWLWDRIFEDAGFTYESEFLNSDIFERLIIPSGKLSQKTSPFWLYINSLRIGMNTDQEFSATQSIYVGPPYDTFNYPIVYFRPESTFRYVDKVQFDNDTTAPNGDPGDFWSTTLFEFTEGNTPKPQTFYLNLDYTYYNKWGGRNRRPDIEDPNSSIYQHYYTWNYFRSELRIKRSMDLAGNIVPEGVCVKIDNAEPFYSQDPGLSTQLPGGNGAGYRWGTGQPINPGFTSPGGFVSLPGPQNNDWVYLLGGHEYIYPADDNWPGQAVSLQPYDGISSTNPYVFGAESIVSSDRATASGFVEWSGQLQISLDGSSFQNQPLRPGEKLWVEVSNAIDRQTYNLLFSSGEAPLKIHNTSLFFNSPTNEVTEGALISVSDSLPEKVKQLDFITSIIRMFNLFVEVDKDDARNLFIEPRDDYYKGGVNRDWSDKLDLLKETKHDIIAEIQNRKIIYTYKEDKDLLNEVYKQRFDEIYGEEEYIINNDFTTGEKKYEVIFSPTPLVQVPEMDGMIVPSIRPIDLTDTSKFAPKIRILQRRKENIQLPVDSYWMFSGITQSSYPYAGNLDNPTQATLDLNFGIVNELYYPNNFLTQNTLFNVYHRRMIEELTDRSSRLITAYFYLNAQDVSRLRFNDTIFVDQLNSGTGVYYRLNKIEYDPMRDGSYKVELLKILNVPGIYFPGLTSSSPTTTPPNQKQPIGGRRPLGVESVEKGLAPFSIGSFNILDNVDSALVLGDDNYVGPNVSSGMIVGSENKINANSKNSAILGGNKNTIGAGASNAILIGGDNGVLTESDRIKFGAIVIDGTNFISAGRNEVLNEYPEGKVVNYISASKNAVRQLGSYDVVNIIKA